MGTNPPLLDPLIRPPQQNWGIVNPNSMNVTGGRLTPVRTWLGPARPATLPMVDVIDMLGTNE